MTDRSISSLPPRATAASAPGKRSTPKRAGCWGWAEERSVHFLQDGHRADGLTSAAAHEWKVSGMTEPDSQPFASRYALAFIFITMLVDTIGLGIIIPVAPKIIAQLTHEDMSGAARWGGWLYLRLRADAVPVRAADRQSERPLRPPAGADRVAAGARASTMSSPDSRRPSAWLFIGRFLSGIAGASYTTANAYIADVSPPEKRAANFGLTGAAFGVGFILGPALGGLLGAVRSAHALLRRRRLVAAQRAVRTSCAEGIAAAGEPPQIRTVARQSGGRARGAQPLSDVSCSASCVVLMRLAHDANPAIWSYYVMFKFHWTPQLVGYSLMAVGALMAVVVSAFCRASSSPGSARRARSIWALSAARSGFAGYAFATAELGDVCLDGAVRADRALSCRRSTPSCPRWSARTSRANCRARSPASAA